MNYKYNCKRSIWFYIFIGVFFSVILLLNCFDVQQGTDIARLTTFWSIELIFVILILFSLKSTYVCVDHLNIVLYFCYIPVARVSLSQIKSAISVSNSKRWNWMALSHEQVEITFENRKSMFLALDENTKFIEHVLAFKSGDFPRAKRNTIRNQRILSCILSIILLLVFILVHLMGIVCIEVIKSKLTFIFAMVFTLADIIFLILYMKFFK